MKNSILLDSLYRENEIVNFRLISKDGKVLNKHYKKDAQFYAKVNKLIGDYNTQYNIYMGVHPRQGNHNSYIDRVTALYVDIDFKDFGESYKNHLAKVKEMLKEKNIEPNISVQSGHGIHLYWLLDSKESKLISWHERKDKHGNIIYYQKSEIWEKITKALIYFCRSDKSVKDLSRILRVPNTKNIKYDKIEDVTEKSLKTKPYKLSNFNALVDEHVKALKAEEKDKKVKKRLEEKIEKTLDKYETCRNKHIDNDFKKAVIKVLEASNISDYDTFLNLAMAFKSENISYSEIDKIFQGGSNYNRENNEEIYNKLDPKSITFGTAYYYAKELNPLLLRQLLKKVAKKEIDKSKDCLFLEKNNKTYFLIETKGGTIKEEATNFIMRIIKNIKNDDYETSFEVMIKSRNKTTIFEIVGEGFPILNDFRKIIGRHGLFLISIKDIAIFNQYLQFIEEKSKSIDVKKTNYLGRVSRKAYLMEDCIITEDGKQELSNLLPNIVQGQQKKMIYRGSEKGCDLKKFTIDINKILGVQTYKFIGFLVSTLYSSEIYNYFSFFPLLFHYGSSQTGKNTIAYLGQACFGTHRAITPFTATSTPKSIQRTMARFSNAFICFNEYKASDKTNSLLVSVFDREAYARAVKDTTNRIIVGEINATMLYMGTHNISGYKAEDLTNRTVELDFDKRIKNRDLVLDWKEKADSLIYFIEYCLKNINPKILLQKIKDTAREARRQNESIQDRIIDNHCIFQASYNYFLETLDLIEELGISNIKADFKKQNENTKSNQIADIVIEIVQKIYMGLVRNKATFDNLEKIMQDETGRIYFRLPPLYIEILQEAKKAGLFIPDKRTITTSLKKKGLKLKSKRVGNGAIKRVAKFWSFMPTDVHVDESAKKYSEVYYESK